MKKHILLYISVGVLLLALAIFLILSLTGTLQFNTKTHAEWEQDGYLFSYRGDKDEIRRLDVSCGDISYSFDIEVSPTLFLSEDMQSAVFLDTDGDSTHILLPFSLDEDGDKHYRLLTVKSDGSASLLLDTDISNPVLDTESGYLISEDAEKINIGKPLNGIAPYEQYARRTAFEISPDGLCAVYEISVTYHSETNIYCFSESVYDVELASLGATTDQWFLPDEYNAERERIASLFTVPIP